MNKFVGLLLFLFFITSCNGPTINKPVDPQTSYFKSAYHNPIAIFPTYKFLGSHKINFAGSIAFRNYYLWKDDHSGKYILITVLTPKIGVFSKDFEWVDKHNAIFSRGNIVVYNNIHERPMGVIYNLDGDLPTCLIVAQEVYFHEKEVIYKALIVPDKMCDEIVEPVISELNRVANMQP